jgi:predicted RNA binding protein YcfA (HicA-like mRNA interferase family)
MTALEKLERRLLANPHEASFRDVAQVLQGHGWVLLRIEGSPHIFGKGGAILPVPVHNKRVPRTYIKQVVSQLGLGPQ